MRFMNEYEIDQAVARWHDHPVLGPASETLSNLRDVTNSMSDGWHSWPKPIRAAAKLMALIEGDGTSESRWGDREDATAKAYKATLGPIKALCTRQKMNVEIVNPR